MSVLFCAVFSSVVCCFLPSAVLFCLLLNCSFCLFLSRADLSCCVPPSRRCLELSSLLSFCTFCTVYTSVCRLPFLGPVFPVLWSTRCLSRVALFPWLCSSCPCSARHSHTTRFQTWPAHSPPIRKSDHQLEIHQPPRSSLVQVVGRCDHLTDMTYAVHRCSQSIICFCRSQQTSSLFIHNLCHSACYNRPIVQA